MMAKNSYFYVSPGSVIHLLWFTFLAVVSADYYDNQLLDVNASWPSGAKLIGADCCDGNLSDPNSLSPFRDGPPTVYLKVTHDDVFPESYIQATNKSLLSSKYLVMATLYNLTETPGESYNYINVIWVQGNMTASTPSGYVSNNDTFVTLKNETEPLLPYNTDFNLSEIVSNLRFDQTVWQLSVGVYQQTPEFEKYLYTKYEDGSDPKQNGDILLRNLSLMFQNLYYGTENPSRFWNSTSVAPWGRIYAYVPGYFDAATTATPTSSGASATGTGSGASSTNSSHPAATSSQAAAINLSVFGDRGSGNVSLFIWMIPALLASLFV